MPFSLPLLLLLIIFFFFPFFRFRFQIELRSTCVCVVICATCNICAVVLSRVANGMICFSSVDLTLRRLTLVYFLSNGSVGVLN